MIQKDIDALEREKSNSNKKYNILEILNNINAIFTGNYLYYKELPKETIFERSIADRIKSRKERLDIINTNKKTSAMICLKNTSIIQAQTLWSKN